MFDIAAQFTQTTITDVTELGQGLINDTFLVHTDSGRFVLQRINRQVFNDPKAIMHNLSVLNTALKRLPGAAVKLRFPELIQTVSGRLTYQDHRGDSWRALTYIENTESLEAMSEVTQASQVGSALGHFHRLTTPLSVEQFQDTLPGFHIAPLYLRYYWQVRERLTGRLSSDEQFCADFIAQRQSCVDVLEEAKEAGRLTLRIIHGDPKLNNFLFDRKTGRVIGLIDLDTVKPGLIHYDVGDCVRSLCHVEGDAFDLTRCEAFLMSYLSELGDVLTQYDYRYLYPAIRLIPFELGLRFFTDHLAGDVYFKTSEPGQNLRRAIGQFRLCGNIEKYQALIEAMIVSADR